MLDRSAKHGISKRVRLVIIDRQPVVLHGLKSVLGTQRDFEVVASCRDGTSGLEAIRNLTPDAALVADTLPDLTVSGILAITKAENLSTRLVFFTEFEPEPDHDLTAALAAGACSAISKHASPATLLHQLRLTTRRSVKRSVSPEQFDLSPTGKEVVTGGEIEKMLQQLTHRERQIVRLVSEGKSNKEIARELNVSPGTVKVHLYNIFQKLEITNRTVLAALALLRPRSGLGTLSIVLLALAVADKLKGSEANDIAPDDNGIGHTGEHAGYGPWKGAILRDQFAWESRAGPPLTQRDSLVRPNSAPTSIETLRTTEQSTVSKQWTYHGPVGSSTPSLPAPLLRGTRDTQLGDPSPEHRLPQLTSDPTFGYGGYGTFAALVGALIYAVNDPHLAEQTYHTDRASFDSFVVAATSADANLVANSPRGLASPQFRLPSAVVTTERESAVGENARGQIGHGAGGDTLQKPAGLVDAGHDASIGGYGRDQAMESKSSENVAHGSRADSDSTSADFVFNFGSGSSRINLAAFGGLAWLHMTAATGSVPPHTLAWIYHSATNETIVYVNSTDRVLDIGDRDLLELHLEGIVSIAASDCVAQEEVTVAAVTLEQLQETLLSATALNDTPQSADDDHLGIGASRGKLTEVGAGTLFADDSFQVQFGQARTDFPAATRFRAPDGGTAGATQEPDGASAVSAHALSIELALGARVTATENPSLESEQVNADTGILSTGSSDIVGQSVATPADANREQSQHALEARSANEATAGSSAAGIKPGNDVGNDAEHHTPTPDVAQASSKAAEAGNVKHESSGHSDSANAPEAADVMPPVGGNTGGGHLQHSSEPKSAKAAAAASSEAGIKPGNDVGNDAEHHTLTSDVAQGSSKAAEAGSVEHGSSGHSDSANAPEAADIAEPGVTIGGEAQQATPSAVIVPEAAQSARAAYETGGTDKEPAFRFDSASASSTLGAAVEHSELNIPIDLRAPPSQQETLGMIVSIVPDEHAPNHGNHGPHVSAPNDFLI
ncbi:response regulator transcription factor [Bradyrhizobium sp. CCBAU 51627]|uniref:response regulator transcription factor n=1 Tax=Bradyrhizobium sp. CCBAU 51627 TaxID=1325088 RepID=UPI00230512F3|nr:response regulator transcription factor [Bradyrhizobium sp. CCBAU 51627]MDA9432295.1 hypothetical protein [Bradyrhizobium sp. CCBAU 51627]